MIICHRFFSPRWWHHLAKHVSGGSGKGEEIYDKLVQLRVSISNIVCVKASRSSLLLSISSLPDWKGHHLFAHRSGRQGQGDRGKRNG